MNAARLETYRTIGPFDERTLPQGLLKEHRLKAGCWGRLDIIAGEVLLVWDDGNGAPVRLGEGDIAVIPPARPHHLEPQGAFSLSIAFQHQF